MTWSTASSRWPITFMCIRYVLIREGKSVDVIHRPTLSRALCRGVRCDSWKGWIICQRQNGSLVPIHVMENGFENNKFIESFRMLSQLALTQKI